MARHRQPLELAKLKGLDKKNPQYYRDEVPKHESPVGEPPATMSEAAMACWDELVSCALPGTLTGGERVMLEIAANMLAEYRADPSACPVSKVTALIGLLARFGMSPSDRQKLGVDKPDKKENPFLKTIE